MRFEAPPCPASVQGYVDFDRQLQPVCSSYCICMQVRFWVSRLARQGRPEDDVMAKPRATVDITCFRFIAVSLILFFHKMKQEVWISV
jgi:hypothetical protein